jgi:Domain of unknown function (DUF3846)
VNITAIVMPADHEQPLRVLHLENPDYKAYQALVSGLIEFVDLPHRGTLCCNDEAKLLELPLNTRATALLYLLRPEFINRDFIAGTAVLLGQPDEEGDTTSAPDLYVQLLAAT